MQHTQCRAHSGGHSDGRGTADDHFFDGFGDFAVVGIGIGDFFGGEAALVQYDYASVGPSDGLGYVHLIAFPGKPQAIECRDIGQKSCSKLPSTNATDANLFIVAKGGPGRRIGYWPGVKCVKPLVAMMEVAASMEL